MRFLILRRLIHFPRSDRFSGDTCNSAMIFSVGRLFYEKIFVLFEFHFYRPLMKVPEGNFSQVFVCPPRGMGLGGWAHPLSRGSPPPNHKSEVCEVYGFTRVCLSTSRGVPGQVPPWTGTHPLGRYTPGRYPPWAGTPPRGSSACWEIRATSARYASYWNAFLSKGVLTRNEIQSVTEIQIDIILY